MTARRLVLFDDRAARDWRPFSLTRPVGELLFGTATLRARAEHALDTLCVGHVAASGLRSFDEPWAPPVLDDHSLDTADGCVFLLSRFVPEPGSLPDRPAILVSGGRVVGCALGPGDPAPEPSFFLDPDDHAPDLPAHPLDGTLLEHVWDLVAGNAERVRQDLVGASHAAIPHDVHHLGFRDRLGRR